MNNEILDQPLAGEISENLSSEYAPIHLLNDRSIFLKAYLD